MEDLRPDAPEPAIAADAIPGYRIVRELGRGGMATVYLAVQESLGREVALKLLTRRLAEDPGAAERFVREARTAARLVHRHIVGIHDVGTAAVEGQGRQPYLAMEYLPGDTLSVGPIAPRKALELAREIALALDHAHRQGVVHRDIKPDNILRRADGSSALADFGIARTADAGPGVTQEGITLGTPHYMSPEQLQGQELDGRSDLYSLGVVLYQLLTGEVPFKGTDGWSVGVQHISAPLPRLPAALARYQGVVDALMAKDPARRPQTGADSAQLIDLALGDSISSQTQAMPVEPVGAASAATGGSRLKPLPQAGRRAEDARVSRRSRAWAIGAIAVLVVAGIGWLALRGPPRSAAIASARSAAASPQPSAVAAASNRSIAVLPLDNMSGNPANEYFSDGLAETILDTLAHVPDLKVIARTSSFAFKGKAMDVREIGRKLGAANLLEGSVQQAGDRVRVSVQLIRASDGAHLWAGKYDRKLADVFAIQDEVASEVVKALQVALPDQAQQHLADAGTTNVQAYQEYLRGIALLPGRKVPEMREAVRHFQSAITLDPRYARALVAYDMSYLLLVQYAAVDEAEMARAAHYLQTALAIAPDLGEAHTARGGELERARQFDAAQREYARGIALAPGYATGFQWYGEFELFIRGHTARGLELLDRAYALDPLSPVVRAIRAFAIGISGRPDEAIALMDQLIADEPNVARHYDTRAGLRAQKGDIVGSLRDAREYARLDSDAVGFRTHECQALVSFGAIAEARACIDALARRAPRSPDVAQARFHLAVATGDSATALQIASANAPPGVRAQALVLAGRNADALAGLRKGEPSLFASPVGEVNALDAADAILAGYLLFDAGQKAQARALVAAALAGIRDRPRGAAQGGRSWLDVGAFGVIGEDGKALDALQQGVSEGFFLDLDELDQAPMLARLRANPRYAAIVAPARARAAAEVAKARALKLL
jgi:serine/threonine protein kinase/tetratricopeptide (TPR) repeat protein